MANHAVRFCPGADLMSWDTLDAMKERLPPTHTAPTSRWRDTVSRTWANVPRLMWLLRNAHDQRRQAAYSLRDERAAEELREAEDGSLRHPPGM